MTGFAYSDHFKGLTIHYRRRLNDDRRSFIESLSSHERNNHKRRAKRLRADFEDAVRIDRFDSVEQFSRLVRDVEFVMQKSYQRRLGVGFINSQRVHQRLEFQAKKGWLRGYILYVRDAPCAFWIGSLYNGTFQSEFMGYDPAYGRYSPGMYLVVSALDELSKSVDERRGASCLDFGAGEGEWKAVLSDQSVVETSAYIFAPTVEGVCINILRSVPAVIDLWIKVILRKWNLLTYVKRIVRKNFARRGN